MKKKKLIYTTLIKEDAHYIKSILDESGFKTDLSNSSLSQLHINAVATIEYSVYVEELYFIDAKFFLEKQEIAVVSGTEDKEAKKREVNYLHDSLRLSIFGMLFVPIILNLLSLFKLYQAVKKKEDLKVSAVIQIVILNTIGLSFWLAFLENKYSISQRIKEIF